MTARRMNIQNMSVVGDAVSPHRFKGVGTSDPSWSNTNGGWVRKAAAVWVFCRTAKAIVSDLIFLNYQTAPRQRIVLMAQAVKLAYFTTMDQVVSKVGSWPSKIGSAKFSKTIWSAWAARAIFCKVRWLSWSFATRDEKLCRNSWKGGIFTVSGESSSVSLSIALSSSGLNKVL